MWFRNARVFRFTKPFEITAEALEEKLQEDAFKPCGPQETSRQAGYRPWVSTAICWFIAPAAIT